MSTLTLVFVYDTAGKLLGEYTSAGVAVREYVYLDRLPVAMYADGQWTYLHADRLGTPRWGTDQEQRLVWRWQSDPFGNGLAEEDPDGDGQPMTVNLRFPGQYFDKETGLHYNYFRDYDPSTGRYIQSDPIGLEGGLNTYAYLIIPKFQP